MQLAWYKVICAVFFETLALERCSVAEVTPIDHSSSSETTVGWIILPYRIPIIRRFRDIFRWRMFHASPVKTLPVKVTRRNLSTFSVID